MENLELKQKTALQLYNQGNDQTRKILMETFGAEIFTTTIIDRVTSFEDACAMDGIKPGDLLNSSLTTDEIAYIKLKQIIRVINEGWVPDWNDTSQRKWYPWFKVSSGFGFSSSHYLYAGAGTTVGSRLCFETQEKCEYVATHFIDLYEQLLIIK